MPLVVVGSVAFDSVETPTEKRDRVLGGSATFFSYAASYFTPVRLAGVVGEDFPPEHLELFKSRNIDTEGLQVVPGGKTFHWRGKYAANMNDRETLEIHLNVFEKFDPVLPADYRSCKYVFLANGSPVLQMKVLDQVPDAQLKVADTMDLWINIALPDLLKLLARRYTPAQAESAILHARSLDFDCVDVNLLFGIPGQAETETAEDAAPLLLLLPTSPRCAGPGGAASHPLRPSIQPWTRACRRPHIGLRAANGPLGKNARACRDHPRVTQTIR